MSRIRKVNRLETGAHGPALVKADQVHHSLMTIAVHSDKRPLSALKRSLRRQVVEIHGQIRDISVSTGFNAFDAARKRHLENAALYANSALDHLGALDSAQNLVQHHAYTDLVKAVSHLHGALLGTALSRQYGQAKSNARHFFSLLDQQRLRKASGKPARDWNRPQRPRSPSAPFIRKPDLPQPRSGKD